MRLPGTSLNPSHVSWSCYPGLNCREPSPDFVWDFPCSLPQWSISTTSLLYIFSEISPCLHGVHRIFIRFSLPKRTGIIIKTNIGFAPGDRIDFHLQQIPWSQATAQKPVWTMDSTILSEPDPDLNRDLSSCIARSVSLSLFSCILIHLCQ